MCRAAAIEEITENGDPRSGSVDRLLNESESGWYFTLKIKCKENCVTQFQVAYGLFGWARFLLIAMVIVTSVATVTYLLSNLISNYWLVFEKVT